MSGAGHDGKLAVRKRTVHVDGMLEPHLFVVSQDNEGRHQQRCEIIGGERWRPRVKRLELRDD